MTSRLPAFPFPVVALLSLVALGGCANSVSFSDIDDFGRVRSSVWLHQDFGDSEEDSIFLSTVPDACDKFTEFYEALDAYFSAFEKLGPGNFDSACADLADPAKDMAAAAEDIYGDDAHYLSLSVRDGRDTEPEEQAYEVGDKQQEVAGEVYPFEGNPYAQYADWDEDGDITEGCGVDMEEDGADDDPYWTLSDGTLEITGVEAGDKVEGSFEGEIEDDDHDDAGEVSFAFKAAYCEIEGVSF